MTISSIMNSGLSALLANQAALKTTSSNIANVNTPNYVRRVVNFEAQSTDGMLGGVKIGSVERAVDQFLTDQRWSASSEMGEADVANRFLDQLQASLGGVSDGRDPASRLGAIGAGLAQLSADPSSIPRRADLLQQMQDFSQGVTDLAKQIQDLRSQADKEIGTTVTRINEMTAKIASLNDPIQKETLNGTETSSLRDDREAAIKELSELVEIKVDEQASGRVTISTPTGYSLVNSQSAQASHIDLAAVSSDTIFPAMTISQTNGITGTTYGTAEPFERHISGGALRGLLDLRDKTLPDMASQLSALAAGTAQAYNAAHNNSTSYPAPTQLAGKTTSLLATDSLGFTGKTTVAIVSSTGALVRRVDVDFSAGTLSVDGGAATAFGQTVGGFTSALNTALGGTGSASFVNGQLTLQATGTNGVAVQQDATTPSDRAGQGFAQTFGLNDMFTSTTPMTFATGLKASDAHGFAAGQVVNFSLRNADGSTGKSFSYTVSGSTMGDVVTGLNAAAAGSGTFILDAKGNMTFTPSTAGATLQVTGDTTQRGGTGQSLTETFGLGRSYQMEQALGFSVRSGLTASNLSLAQLDLTATTAIGSTVLASADNKGVLALQAAPGTVSFPPSGDKAATTTSLSTYASGLVSTIGQKAASAASAAEDAAALQGDLENRVQSRQGVNMDEELANMIMFQQAYNAGARLITTAQKLYDELLQMLN